MDDSLIEELAELEHEQWMGWSKEIVKTESISDERKKRWKKLWIPYSELPINAKVLDRRWAEKVIGVYLRRDEA